ncbi:MAG: Lipid export ATP-binding/permease protein MsbA [Pseudomonadota bacterium]|jgi:subfamily B ATP-binding cassette protein MsbA
MASVTDAPTSPLWPRLQRILPYFSPSWGYALLAVLASIGAAATEPLIPALFKPLLDKGFSPDGFPLWMIPLALVLLFLLRGTAHFVGQYALTRIANDGVERLRNELFARLTRADLGLFSRQSASSLSNALVYEVQSGATMLVGAFTDVLRDGFTLIALLAYLFWLNWQLTLLVLTVVPALAWIMKKLSSRLYRLTRESQLATDDLAYVVEENVLAHRVVRLHAAQDSQIQRFAGLGQRLRRLALKSTVAAAAMTPLTQLISALGLSLVVVLALVQSRQGINGATVGSFVAFITAMLMLISPIRKLSDVFNPVTRGLAGLERGLELMGDTPAESSGQHRSARAQGRIEWRAVSLQYKPDVAPALDGIDLCVQPGEVVALVGSSGAGKTTLVQTLPRFAQPTQGQVLLDGVALPAWSLDALRQQIAMVSQDVVMLNDTVAANVALGQAIDPARVQACLQAANLWGHVSQLPQGMDSLIGHNASQLSGGQRQRLAIARALYKDAPILVLDEATSALDNESERLVQEALQALMRGRTTLIVAHRLSTIEHADRVVVMERGRIVEQGTPAALLSAGGAYSRLHQRGEFNPPAHT